MGSNGHLPHAVLPTATFALGSRKLYDFMHCNPAVELHPSDITNDPWLGTGHLHDLTVVTPAFRAGIKAGDLIIKLDDTPVKGMTLNDAVKRMRGKPKTSIVLTIIRKGEAKPLTVTLVREIIKVQSVKSKLVEPGYGYVRVVQFQEQTAASLVQHLDRLVKLPTRTAFIEAIDQHIRTGTTAGYTVGLIDIDQFAETNEAFGHGYGDAVLRGIAERLDDELGESCRIARTSGDTFGVLGLSWAVRPEKLRPLFAEPLNIDNEVRHQLSISMGFAHLADVTSGNDAIKNGEAEIVEGGALCAETGHHTGRSPKDKFTVRDALTDKSMWWGGNQSITSEQFEALYQDFLKHCEGKSLFAQDLYGGADPKFQIKTRVFTELAWHSLFIRTLLRRPETAELASFVPELTIIDLPSFRADPARHGCKSENIVAIDFARKIVLIGGSQYAGEMKKSVFTTLNYFLPEKGVMPMHCSANVGPNGDTAIFFGLSGTGKTTLSADASRTLIGDDEHGWSDTAVFNFEGGCYAKMIRLSAEAEPEIFATTKRFGTVLENVVIDRKSVV